MTRAKRRRARRRQRAKLRKLIHFNWMRFESEVCKRLRAELLSDMPDKPEFVRRTIRSIWRHKARTPIESALMWHHMSAATVRIQSTPHFIGGALDDYARANWSTVAPMLEREGGREYMEQFAERIGVAA